MFTIIRDHPIFFNNASSNSVTRVESENWTHKEHTQVYDALFADSTLDIDFALEL